MEMLEKIAQAFADEVKAKCPFQEDSAAVASLEEEPESIEDDDRDSVVEMQANNGGILGENLAQASPGKAGTVGGPCPPPKTTAEKQQDTDRAGVKVHVPGADGVEDKVLPFTVAAHHLIPGNASLKESHLYEFMKKGGKVQSVSGKSWTISAYVGYNINGSHNGVWLPGSYAIRAGKTELKDTWSVLRASKPNWCINYAASVVKVAGGQFHDTHTIYSEKVQETLDKIAVSLFAHVDVCEECQKKDELPPPYLVKDTLYAISAYLRPILQGHPSTWKSPWFASDKLRDEIFSGSTVSKGFMDAYKTARRYLKRSVEDDHVNA
ncbi:AHH domain-containing protein [Pyxidicoccus parkwayensis]|uniref:AHH domain-containing protein n=1 Tax=Pyxidicoccus parkwayensis TaxID=2813578 RepID=A0ABX7P1T0_9BACT|nr:AHH domain-containing protein [Pyxidicoccus parkwaysis]QSQ24076.1 AHH domain-containing protein [Pyxidicoccus parkwaysis]